MAIRCVVAVCVILTSFADAVRTAHQTIMQLTQSHAAEEQASLDVIPMSSILGFPPANSIPHIHPSLSPPPMSPNSQPPPLAPLAPVKQQPFQHGVDSDITVEASLLRQPWKKHTDTFVFDEESKSVPESLPLNAGGTIAEHKEGVKTKELKTVKGSDEENEKERVPEKEGQADDKNTVETDAEKEVPGPKLHKSGNNSSGLFDWLEIARKAHEEKYGKLPSQVHQEKEVPGPKLHKSSNNNSGVFDWLETARKAHEEKYGKLPSQVHQEEKVPIRKAKGAVKETFVLDEEFVERKMNKNHKKTSEEKKKDKIDTLTKEKKDMARALTEAYEALALAALQEQEIMRPAREGRDVEGRRRERGRVESGRRQKGGGDVAATRGGEEGAFTGRRRGEAWKEAEKWQGLGREEEARRHGKGQGDVRAEAVRRQAGGGEEGQRRDEGGREEAGRRERAGREEAQRMSRGGKDERGKRQEREREAARGGREASGRQVGGPREGGEEGRSEKGRGTKSDRTPRVSKDDLIEAYNVLQEAFIESQDKVMQLEAEKEYRQFMGARAAAEEGRSGKGRGTKSGRIPRASFEDLVEAYNVMEEAFIKSQEKVAQLEVEKEYLTQSLEGAWQESLRMHRRVSKLSKKLRGDGP